MNKYEGEDDESRGLSESNQAHERFDCGNTEIWKRDGGFIGSPGTRPACLQCDESEKEKKAVYSKRLSCEFGCNGRDAFSEQFQSELAADILHYLFTHPGWMTRRVNRWSFAESRAIRKTSVTVDPLTLNAYVEERIRVNCQDKLDFPCWRSALDDFRRDFISKVPVPIFEVNKGVHFFSFDLEDSFRDSMCLLSKEESAVYALGITKGGLPKGRSYLEGLNPDLDIFDAFLIGWFKRAEKPFSEKDGLEGELYYEDKDFEEAIKDCLLKSFDTFLESNGLVAGDTRTLLEKYYEKSYFFRFMIQRYAFRRTVYAVFDATEPGDPLKGRFGFPLASMALREKLGGRARIDIELDDFFLAETAHTVVELPSGMHLVPYGPSWRGEVECLYKRESGRKGESQKKTDDETRGGHRHKRKKEASPFLCSPVLQGVDPDWPCLTDFNEVAEFYGQFSNQVISIRSEGKWEGKKKSRFLHRSDAARRRIVLPLMLSPSLGLRTAACFATLATDLFVSLSLGSGEDHGKDFGLGVAIALATLCVTYFAAFTPLNSFQKKSARIPTWSLVIGVVVGLVGIFAGSFSGATELALCLSLPLSVVSGILLAAIALWAVLHLFRKMGRDRKKVNFRVERKLKIKTCDPWYSYWKVEESSASGGFSAIKCRLFDREK